MCVAHSTSTGQHQEHKSHVRHNATVFLPVPGSKEAPGKVLEEASLHGVFVPVGRGLEVANGPFKFLLHLRTREALIQKVILQMNLQRILCGTWILL